MHSQYSLSIEPDRKRLVYADFLLFLVCFLWFLAIPQAASAEDAWAQLGLAGKRIWTIAQHPTVGTTLYAGDDSRFLVSTDGGASWINIAIGIDSARDIIFDPNNPSRIYVGGSGGLAKSVDGGQTWTRIDAHQGLGPSEAPSVPVSVRSITISPTGTIYAVVRWFSNGGLFKSTDAGSTWTTVVRGVMPGTTLTSDSETIFNAVATDSQGNIYVSRGLDFRKGIFKSTDGGATWSVRLPDVQVVDIKIDPANDAVIYVGVSQRYGVMKSIDGGNTWADAIRFRNATFSSGIIAIDPMNPTTVYAAIDAPFNGGGMYKSVDAGATSQTINNGWTGRAPDLLVDKTNPVVLYAASESNGIYVFKPATPPSSPIEVEGLSLDYFNANIPQVTNILYLAFTLHNKSNQPVSNVKIATFVDSPAQEISPFYDASWDSDQDGDIDQIGPGATATGIVAKLPIPALWENHSIGVSKITVSNQPYQVSFQNTVSITYVVGNNGLPYLTAVDGYHFKNPGLGDWHAFVAEIWAYSYSTPPILNLLYPLFVEIKQWDGRCFGMATTSNLYFEDPTAKPINKVTNSMDLSDPGVAEEIFRYHISQNTAFDVRNPKIYYGPDPSYGGGMSKLISDALALIKNNNPFVLILQGDGGHAVSAFKVIENATTQETFFVVYDNNYPGVPKAAKISKKDGTFEYGTYNLG